MIEKNIHQLSELAIRVALDAGGLINSYRDTEVNVLNKGKGGSLAADVVTEVDIKAQAIIEVGLKSACEEYHIAFLGEESSDDHSRLKKDYFWSVDPIDGTLPFCEKRSGYSVSIALVRSDGIPMIGVVYDPLSDKLYHAIKGEGAYINRQELQSIEPASKKLTCFFDRSYSSDPSYEPLIASVKCYAEERKFRGIDIVTGAGAVLNACWVLENSPAIYVKLPKDKGGSLWDYAATTCLFNELGLPAYGIDGNAFELNRKESTYMNHKGILFSSDEKLAKFIIEAVEKIT